MDIRKLQNIISEIDVSIIYANEFSNQTSNLSHINEAQLKSNECKFCGNENVKLKDKQDKLVDAINWFNSEMYKSKYTIESFTSNKKEYERSLDELRIDANKIKNENQSFINTSGGNPILKEKITYINNIVYLIVFGIFDLIISFFFL